MERRGFLGRLLAIAAAPVVARELGVEPPVIDTPVGEWAVEAVEPYGMAVSYSEIAEELKNAYPPGGFDEFVSAPSPWRKALRR